MFGFPYYFMYRQRKNNTVRSACEIPQLMHRSVSLTERDHYLLKLPFVVRLALSVLYRTESPAIRKKEEDVNVL